MKRMLAMTMVCTMLFCGTAFAAERPTAFLVDGVRTELKHDLYQENGKTMISVEDLARATGGWLQQSEEGDHVKLTVENANSGKGSIWLRYPKRSVSISYWREAELPRGFVRSEQTKDGILYVPFRETAENLFYGTGWQRGAQEDFVSLNNWKPQLSVQAAYQKETNLVTTFITNGEVESYVTWHDFDLEKWNETAEVWERMLGRAEIDYVGTAIFPGNGATTKKNYSARNYGDILPAGTYRIIFPVSAEGDIVWGKYMVSGTFTVQ